MAVNFSFIHTLSAVGTHEKFSLTNFFSWNQLFSNFFLKTLLSRNFCQKCVRQNFKIFPIHTVEITEIYSHWKKFRQLNYLVIYLAKMLLSRNFCHKRVRVNFLYFQTLPLCEANRNYGILPVLLQKFRQIRGVVSRVPGVLVHPQFLIWSKDCHIKMQ